VKFHITSITDPKVGALVGEVTVRLEESPNATLGDRDFGPTPDQLTLSVVSLEDDFESNNPTGQHSSSQQSIFPLELTRSPSGLSDSRNSPTSSEPRAPPCAARSGILALMLTLYSVPGAKLRIPSFLLLLCLFLTGCGGIGILKPDAAGPNENESVLVFGVQPADHGIMFFPGTVQDGKFKPAPSTGFVDTVISDVPRGGYVVAHARAGQQLALMVVNVPKAGAQGGQFHVCGGARALVVEVPKARVAYVADIDFTPQGSKLNLGFSTHLDAARDHVRKNFPNLRGDMEILAPKLLPTANECVFNSPSTILIYR